MSVTNEWMNMKPNWITMTAVQWSTQNMSWCHSIHHIFYVQWPRMEPGPPWFSWQLTSWMMAGSILNYSTQINHFTNIIGEEDCKVTKFRTNSYTNNQFFCYIKLYCFAAQLLTLFWTHFPAVSICCKRFTHAVTSSEKVNFSRLQNQFSPLIITKVIAVQHFKCSQITTQWSGYWQASVHICCDCSRCWLTDVLQYLVWDLPWQTSALDCGSFIHKLV
jgi:hypothetical protein